MTATRSVATHTDISFAVPFVHRLRFTDDVLGDEQQVLLDVLEKSGPRPLPVTPLPRGERGNREGPARVQFWLDGHVANAQPDLADRLSAFAAAHPQDIVQAGDVHLAPGGEAIKNDIHLLERMLSVFEAANLDRRSYVVVVGGGAVLDAVGFAAAIAHRGLRLVRLPTTTLSQADSGVGVKNSVNLFGKKNWIGTFAVPWAVINDAALLSTLPDRDFICGFSEAVKVSLLKDRGLFERICRDAEAIRRRDPVAAQPVIRASAEWHLRHITRGGDPFENEVARPLDFGHWSAHKLEIMSNFALRHGEAVAIGVAIDCVYSTLVHGFARRDAERVLRCLAELGFPLSHPCLADTEVLFAGLEEFRQHLGGELTLTMLRGVGEPMDVHEVDHGSMGAAIEAVMDFSRRHCPAAHATEASTYLSSHGPDSHCR